MYNVRQLCWIVLLRTGNCVATYRKQAGETSVSNSRAKKRGKTSLYIIIIGKNKNVPQKISKLKCRWVLFTISKPWKQRRYKTRACMRNPSVVHICIWTHAQATVAGGAYTREDCSHERARDIRAMGLSARYACGKKRNRKNRKCFCSPVIGAFIFRYSFR